MVNWILRPIMVIAAVIAGWFVARDAVNFSVIQMVVGLLLITTLVAIAACWEMIADRLKSKKNVRRWPSRLGACKPVPILIDLLLGETSEALLLSAFATASVVITIVQEFRSERVLQALRDLTSPRALVLRGGVRRRIAGREVARGDILIVSEGDRIAADALLLQGGELAVGTVFV